MRRVPLDGWNRHPLSDPEEFSRPHNLKRPEMPPYGPALLYAGTVRNQPWREVFSKQTPAVRARAQTTPIPDSVSLQDKHRSFVLSVGLGQAMLPFQCRNRQEPALGKRQDLFRGFRKLES